MRRYYRCDNPQSHRHHIYQKRCDRLFVLAMIVLAFIALFTYKSVPEIIHYCGIVVGLIAAACVVIAATMVIYSLVWDVD